MKHHGAIGEGRGGGGFNFGRVFLIVIGIHVLFGGGLFWMAKTQSGQMFAKTYNIKFFEPPKPPKQEEPPKPEEPPPPEVEPSKVEAPQVAMAPPRGAPAPSIGGDLRAGNSWSGGRFVGGFGEGPEGAFHAGVTRLFRQAYVEPKSRFGPAELELRVSGSGQVQGFRLTKSSGDAAQDQALLAAARQVQAKGTPPPPERQARMVTVRFYPY